MPPHVPPAFGRRVTSACPSQEVTLSPQDCTPLPWPHSRALCLQLNPTDLTDHFVPSADPGRIKHVPAFTPSAEEMMLKR